jgi:Transposase
MCSRSTVWVAGVKQFFRKRLRRSQVAEFFQHQTPCLIGIEATQGAHYWARVLRALGHDVRLLAPQFVKPYLKSQKNDANDAEAICEAVSRPNMRFVPNKSIEQQDLHPHSAWSGNHTLEYPSQARRFYRIKTVRHRKLEESPDGAVSRPFGQRCNSNFFSKYSFACAETTISV